MCAGVRACCARGARAAACVRAHTRFQIAIGGGGSRGAGVRVREILVVVTQCLLLLNSYTTQGRVLGKE